MIFKSTTLLKILSIVVPLLVAVAYFTIAKKKCIKYIFQRIHFNTVYLKDFLNSDSKNISSLYFTFSILTALIGMLPTIYLKLAITGTFDFFTYKPAVFNVILTGHAVIMIFFSSMAVFIGGFSYMLLPLMLNLKQFRNAFPTLSLFSFWLLVLSFLIFLMVLIFELYLGESWTITLPYCNFFLQSIDFLIGSIYCFALSYFLVAVNFVVTIFNSKVTKWSIFVLTIFITSQLLILFLPVFIGVTTMYLMDYTFLSIFYGSVGGSDALPWTHLLWFFAHPAVYILILPSLGIISQIVLYISKKCNPETKYLFYNIWFIGFLGYFGWVLNLVALSFDFDVEFFMTAARMIVIFPLFFIIINWLFILWNCSIEIDTSILFALGYIITFLLGLVTAFILSLHDIQNMLYDTDYITAQFHYFTALLIFFSIFAGFYSCSKRIIGVYCSEILGQIHFWIFFIGVHLTFFPTFFFGIGNLKKHDIDVNWQILDIFNYMSLLGFSFLIASFFFFFLVLAEAFLSNRTDKDLILNSKFFIHENSSKTLDFVINICFFVYFIIYFLISIINKIYWILFIYCFILFSILVVSMLPKVRHYFSPVAQESSMVYNSYKTDWAVLYYTIQFIKIGFLGLILYLMFYLKLSAIDYYRMASLEFYLPDNFLKSFTSIKIFNFLLPIFVVAIIVETVLKLYILFFTNTSNETPSTQSTMIVRSKKSLRWFSTATGQIKVAAKQILTKTTATTSAPPILSPFAAKCLKNNEKS